MADNDNGVSRRNVLKIAGSSMAVAGTAGLAGARGRVEVNVGFASERGRQKALGAADETVRDFDSLDIVTAKMPAQAAKGLRNNPNIRYVEENGTVQAHAQTLPWGIDRVDADVAHSNGDTGSGADIAILDTGIDSDHPDLQANLGTGKDFSGKGTWEDGDGHGTHCAGIANAVNNSEGVVGVSTEATLHAGKVLGDDGSGSFSDVAAGIEWAANQGFDVASLSLGASSGTTALQDAVDYAYNNGVLVVSSAGNSGPCNDCVGFPAAYSNAMAISEFLLDRFRNRTRRARREHLLDVHRRRLQHPVGHVDVLPACLGCCRPVDGHRDVQHRSPQRAQELRRRHRSRHQRVWRGSPRRVSRAQRRRRRR